MNHYRIGGAERSALEQAALLVDCEIDLIVPKELGEYTEYLTQNEIKFHSHSKILIHPYLLEVSRASILSQIRGVLGFLISFYGFYSFKFEKYDSLWMNGMKIFIYLLPVLILKKFQGTIYFHLRDYIPPSWIIKLLFKLSIKLGLKVEIIANSNSVEKDFNLKFTKLSLKTQVCFNPSLLACSQKGEAPLPRVLGVCSMFAPWKGIHCIVLFANLFENELKNLGIEEVAIYGDNIYSSLGDHSHYAEEIFLLNKKLGGCLVTFKGLENPLTIYNDIDILIHSSNAPEPFGRVILEAYGQGIPVISTGLGGANEVLLDRKELIYSKYSYKDLLQAVERICSEQSYRDELSREMKQRHQYLNDMAKKQINQAILS